MKLDERNEELDRKINETKLPDAVKILIADAKKRRYQMIALTASLLLDFLITIILGFVAAQTHSTASKAESNQQALVRACQTSNAARANNKQLWTYLLSLPPPSIPTTQQKQVRDQFSDFIDKTFAPSDCSKIAKN
jgi:hypothetical protein